LVRSAIFCCSIIELRSTACFAWPAAWIDWSCRVLRSSTDCSAVTSCEANACADCSYWPALTSSPDARAWSASTSACRAEACSFSISPSWRLSFISSWRWLPITAAACWESAWCWRCASSMACWICTLGSAYSSTFDENNAIRYFQAFVKPLAICSALRVRHLLRTPSWHR
jgi:hypothetical protein